MPRHELLVRTESLRMLDCSGKYRKMGRMRTRPLLQIRPVAMEARSTSLPDRLAFLVQVLQETKANGTCFFWMVPKVLHTFHEYLLEVSFVGFSLYIVALDPPLPAT